MADWKVTATTVYCESVGDEVTIMVYPDFSARCTGDAGRQMTTAAPSRKNGRRTGRAPGCAGLDCPRVNEYRDRLAQEELSRGQPPDPLSD